MPRLQQDQTEDPSAVPVPVLATSFALTSFLSHWGRRMTRAFSSFDASQLNRSTQQVCSKHVRGFSAAT